MNDLHHQHIIDSMKARADQSIQTAISNVFLSGETVYKIYRKDNTGFNQGFRDLANTVDRRKFYEEDFFWNNYFNPEVYRALKGIKIIDNTVEIVNETENVDDLVIEMKRIDTHHSMTDQLREGSLNNEDLQKIGFQMTELIDNFPHKPVDSRSFYELMKLRLIDVQNWAYLASPGLNNEAIDEVIRKFNLYVDTHKDYFLGFTPDQLAVAIDNHSDNIYYRDGKILFMDIYQVKENWLIVHPLLNAARLSVNALILGNEELAQSLLNGYKEYYNDEGIDEELVRFYQAYAALIQCPIYYLYGLVDDPARKAEANQYWNFILDTVKDY